MVRSGSSRERGAVRCALSSRCADAGPLIHAPDGVFDHTCSYDLAREYFQRLQAPVKGFYTFEHSAHSPIFEEPEKAGQIMREDVLNAVARLADN
jgi:pimeloyl-ACP methyl ester carboxylesterase